MTVPVEKTPRLAIPKLGLGTWQLRDAEGQKSVESALSLGYRHLDTAARYANEAEVGSAIQASGVARGDIFLTSKVWWENLEPEALYRSLENSLSLLKTDYLDLFLIHWPTPSMDLEGAIKVLKSAQGSGMIRAWGVSNFPIALMQQVEALGETPAALQVEYHVLLSQAPLLEWCQAREIVLEAYSPLAQGKLRENEVLARIGAKHGASAAQVGLAWLLRQKGVVPIPKASSATTQQANLDAIPLAAKLDAEDVAAIDALPKDQRLVNPAFAPSW
ncbi:aldo/keto reductase [Roseomonas aerophila]|uniref:Aldo/keto reductase n=1 Tax=Teichococcus aerophilus TaxID=1224513 RepID=A0ABR7RJH0_9PROT|nr:aldo/keto reductase [Pseudoroseomonas aerophila]MBC9206275.1 aldo/keto reductase [Pseudoroseomonas aerophila]